MRRTRQAGRGAYRYGQSGAHLIGITMCTITLALPMASGNVPRVPGLGDQLGRLSRGYRARSICLTTELVATSMVFDGRSFQGGPQTSHF